MQSVTMMMIILISILSTTNADLALSCHNDYYNSFWCTWNISSENIPPDAKCSLNISVEKNSGRQKTNKSMYEQMLPEPDQPDIRSASVHFKENGGIIISVAKLYQFVHCENYSNPVAQINPVKATNSVVILSPPQNVSVSSLNASWSFNSKKSPLFELEFRCEAQSWSKPKETTETHMQLSEDLLKYRECVVRVRAKLRLKNAEWSLWSQEYSWNPSEGHGLILYWYTSPAWILIAFTVIFICILPAFIRVTRSRFQKDYFTFSPDPSKFFGDLNHEGNIKSWMGPVLSRESFVKHEIEFLSPVEILKPLHKTSSLNETLKKTPEQWDDSQNISDFSNSTYFLSQSSRDNPGICSSGPPGGATEIHSQDAHAEEMVICREEELEKLRRDTSSPDSGFDPGAEDSREEPEVHSPVEFNIGPRLTLAASLEIGHLMGASLGGLHPLLGSFSLQTPLTCVIPELELLNGCGILEPCSEDYMPVKNLQN